MTADTVLFDLDGTLTDPGIGITNSVMYALRRFGITENDREALYAFIGPPLIDSFMKLYGFSKQEAIQAVVYYREYFSKIGIYENEVYEGVPGMLSSLKAQEKKIVLATSKPEVYAKEILKHFSLDGYFSFVAGATMDEKRSRKEDVIAYAIKMAGISDCRRAVMVGDREYDILGAKKFHMASVGVLYGYGSENELSLAGADYLAHDTEELMKILFFRK